MDMLNRPLTPPDQTGLTNCYEVVGLSVFTVLIGAGVALATWSADDPSLNNAIDGTASNWLGYPGAVLADQLMQFFGLGVLPLMAIPMAWAVRFMGHQGMIRPIRSVFSWFFACLCASATLSALPAPSSWSTTPARSRSGPCFRST